MLGPRTAPDLSDECITGECPEIDPLFRALLHSALSCKVPALGGYRTGPANPSPQALPLCVVRVALAGPAGESMTRRTPQTRWMPVHSS